MLEAFTWGYWGWGGSTPELVEAFDAGEKHRGYEPPVFVDVRVRRSVRARGFRGDAFEKLLGPTRHRWMQGLGNQGILDDSQMRLGDETEVRGLLDLIVEHHAGKRRVIFFCSCASTSREDGDGCHRHLVAKFLVKEARRRKLALSVVEWPGGAPRHLAETFPPEAGRASLREGHSVPIPPGMLAATAVTVPWGSYALVKNGSDLVPVVVGPAIHGHGRWALQHPWIAKEFSTELRLQKDIMANRKRSGLDAHYSLPSGHDGEAPWQELGVGAPKPD